VRCAKLRLPYPSATISAENLLPIRSNLNSGEKLSMLLRDFNDSPGHLGFGKPEGKYVTEEIFDNQLRPFFLKKYHPPNRELIYTRNVGGVVLLCFQQEERFDSVL
jgi:hypothetical protein